MKLSELLLGVRIKGKMPETEVFGISTDSQSVKKGNLFICIKGGRADGHDYARLALDTGAALVLAERMPHDVEKARVILTEDTRKAASVAWYNFYGRPADGMTKIAVTGTAGKTSVAFILRGASSSSSGRRVGVVTTIRAMSGYKNTGAWRKRRLFGKRSQRSYDNTRPRILLVRRSRDEKRRMRYRDIPSVVTISPEKGGFGGNSRLVHFHESLRGAHGRSRNDGELFFHQSRDFSEGVKNAVVNVDDEYFSRLPDMFRSCNFIRVSARRENAGKTEVCALRYHSMGENGTEYVYLLRKSRVQSAQPSDRLLLGVQYHGSCRRRNTPRSRPRDGAGSPCVV